MLPFDKLFDFLCSLFYEILHKELKKVIVIVYCEFWTINAIPATIWQFLLHDYLAGQRGTRSEYLLTLYLLITIKFHFRYGVLWYVWVFLHPCNFTRNCHCFYTNCWTFDSRFFPRKIKTCNPLDCFERHNHTSYFLQIFNLVREQRK